MNALLLTVEIRSELDVVFVRQRARQIAVLLKFDGLDQTRISTAVSEIARNAFLYARGGRAQFFVEAGASEQLMIRIIDRGPGIPNVAAILGGTYRSRTGMGLGMRGAHKLMDAFRVDTTSEHGTTIEMGKTLPRSMPKMSASFLAHISSELAKAAPGGPLEEIRQQNIELLQALDDLKTRQIELDRTVHELTDAHEKLTSINLELEDKAVALQRKTAAEQLARAEAETAVALREDMLAIVSHDLRTPLASIVASAAVIEGSADHEGPEWRERTRKSSAIIMRSAYRMRRLIADLLDLAQIRTGKMMIHHDDVRAEALIEESLDTVQALATQGELSLSGTSPTTLWVRCDRERVLQILSNLLSNAIKFTPGGGSVTVDAQESGREALFIVADTGQGMSKDDLPHIFNRFWQAEKRNSAGIGLGLSIVAGLVEAHGGRVWAEAAVGSGSRFFFTLPLAQTSHIG